MKWQDLGAVGWAVLLALVLAYVAALSYAISFAWTRGHYAALRKLRESDSQYPE